VSAEKKRTATAMDAKDAKVGREGGREEGDGHPAWVHAWRHREKRERSAREDRRDAKTAEKRRKRK
jgi:hypothetical protein